MSFELPTEKVKAHQINPKRLVLFGHPKCGKTHSLSLLEDNLILDLEGGSGFVTGLKIDVLKISQDMEILPIQALREVLDQIRMKNKEKGSYVYKYITIDTISIMEDRYALDLALKLYKTKPIGRNFQGENILDLPQGAGYGPLREAVGMILDEVEELCETLIISGHTKEKILDKQGKEFTSRFLDLTGKLPGIVCSTADAVGYVYRKDNETIINFKSSEELVVGARCEHLKNKEITILESDEQGNIIDHWDKIFV